MTGTDLLKSINDSIEVAIKPIINKGASMSPNDLEILSKAVCILEKINGITDGNSYNSGHSTRYYGTHHGYSGHSITDRMIDRLESMMDETQSDYERQTIRDWINRLKA